MPYGPVYTASKTGVVGFTRSLRNLAETESVRVNCICPEFTDTAMIGAMSASSPAAFEDTSGETLELVRRIGLLQ